MEVKTENTPRTIQGKKFFIDLSPEEQDDFEEKAGKAMLSGDIEGAFAVIKTCIVTKHMQNVYRAGLGEEQIQKMKNEGFVFED